MPAHVSSTGGVGLVAGGPPRPRRLPRPPARGGGRGDPGPVCRYHVRKRRLSPS